MGKTAGQLREREERTSQFRFNFQELGGALGDLGTLLPLMVALILINGLNATLVLSAVGLFYVVSGIYFRIPMPVQPLKAVAAISIALGLPASVIGAAGLIMGLILLFLSVTNLIAYVARLFPKAVVRGIQLSVGVMLLRRGVDFMFGDQAFSGTATGSANIGSVPIGVVLAVSAVAVFLVCKFVVFGRGRRFSPALAVVAFGLGAGFVFGPTPGIDRLGPSFPSLALPSASDFWLALTVLVVPQLPLTLGNAVVGMGDTAKTYFGEGAHRVSPRALAASMGVANLAAGGLGAMPMCHGAGGLTAHYKLGARTAGASLMIGGALLVMGIVFGNAAPSLLALIPLAVLGVLLIVVGFYHAMLVRDLKTRRQFVVTGTVAVAAVASGNLAIGFASGIAVHHTLRFLQHHRPSRPRLLSQIGRAGAKASPALSPVEPR